MWELICSAQNVPLLLDFPLASFGNSHLCLLATWGTPDPPREGHMAPSGSAVNASLLLPAARSVFFSLWVTFHFGLNNEASGPEIRAVKWFLLPGSRCLSKQQTPQQPRGLSPQAGPEGGDQTGTCGLDTQRVDLQCSRRAGEGSQQATGWADRALGPDGRHTVGLGVSHRGPE